MLSKRYSNDGHPCLRLNSIQLDQKRKIEEHIVSDYVFENVNCLVCGGSKFEPLSEKDRYGLYMPVVICRDCGLVQASPRMTEASYTHFYNDGDRRLYVGSDQPDDAYFQGRYRAGRATYDYLSQHIEIKGKRILEVGCGSGAILKYLHDSGANVKGIDLSLEYLKYGKERYGLDLSTTNLFDLPDNHEFDLVIYSDVMEHIIAPREHLDKIKGLLKPDGVLYIKVPGTKNLLRPYLGDFLKSLQNAHVYYFSLTTLHNLISSCGYKMIEGNEEVRSLWNVSGETADHQLKNDFSACMEFLQKTEKRIWSRKFLPLAAWCMKKARNLTSSVVRRKSVYITKSYGMMVCMGRPILQIEIN
ncbi:class I SAM-dependent methyltransferase, partial [Pontiellaceae bacterium B12219]|nr:class I SAM-dependent methyltransferase [Pontiellaceae bacterium B12219]